MNDRSKEQEIAEFLAAKTDCILAGTQPEKINVPAAADKDIEMLTTIEKLARLVPPQTPEAGMQNRIRARLGAHWSATGPGASPKRSWAQIFGSKKMAFAWGAIGITALLLIGIVATPAVIPAQSGAAAYQPVALAAGIIILGIVALVFWLTKRKP